MIYRGSLPTAPVALKNKGCLEMCLILISVVEFVKLVIFSIDIPNFVCYTNLNKFTFEVYYEIYV